ncbi:MAG: hypothetical protein QXT86_08895 [Archaeoglobaceae archaeon]
MAFFLWVTEDKIHVITKEDLYPSKEKDTGQNYLPGSSVSSSTLSRVFILKPEESKFLRIELGPFSTTTFWIPKFQPKKKKEIPLKYLTLMQASF